MMIDRKKQCTNIPVLFFLIMQGLSMIRINSILHNNSAIRMFWVTMLDCCHLEEKTWGMYFIVCNWHKQNMTKKNNKFLYFGILLEADDWQTERKCWMKSNFPFLCQIENLLNFEAMSMNICRFRSYVWVQSYFIHLLIHINSALIVKWDFSCWMLLSISTC